MSVRGAPKDRGEPGDAGTAGRRPLLVFFAMWGLALGFALVLFTVSLWPAGHATSPVLAATLATVAPPATSVEASATTSSTSTTSTAITEASGSTQPRVAEAPPEDETAGESEDLPATLPETAGKVAVPILVYHYVDERPPAAGPYSAALTVRTNDFMEQMDYLYNNHFRSVSLTQIYRAMAGTETLPAKAVVLTFDDGGSDNYDVVFPILLARGLTATFFVVTGAVGREGQMTWDQLREMAAAGMDIESHTVSHPDLRTLPAPVLAVELQKSREAILREVGRPSYVLAYPAGRYNQAVEKAARAAGYRMAVGTRAGKENPPSGTFHLKRRGVPAGLSLTSFARMVR